MHSLISLSQTKGPSLPVLEAFLFSENDGRSVAQISRRVGVSEDKVRRGLVELETRYSSRHSGLELKWFGEKVRLGAKHKFTQGFYVGKELARKRSKELLDEYFGAKRLADTTRKTYEGFLYRFAETIEVSVDRVDVQTIRNFLQVEQEERGNSLKTINNKIDMLTSMFDWLLLERHSIENPMLRVERFPLPPSLPRGLSYEEVEKARDIATGISKALFELMYSTGLRVGEVSNLDRSDVDLVGRTILVRDGKGGKSREGRVSTRATLVLKQYLETRTDDDPWLFRSNFRNRLSVDSIQRYMGILGEKAGLHRRLTPHMLRHSFATHLLDAGVPIEIVQQLLGHESVRTTQIYAKVNLKNVAHFYDKVFP